MRRLSGPIGTLGVAARRWSVMCRGLMRTCLLRSQLSPTVEGSSMYNCPSTRITHLLSSMVPSLFNSTLFWTHDMFLCFGFWTEITFWSPSGSSFHFSAWPTLRTNLCWGVGDLLEAYGAWCCDSGHSTLASDTCVPLVHDDICPTLVEHKAWLEQRQLETFVHSLTQWHIYHFLFDDDMCSFCKEW